MKKAFVDEIESKGDKNSPGAGSYKINFIKGSRNSSIGARLNLEQVALDKSSKLPGPGSYEHSLIIGHQNKNSKVKTEANYSFG